MQTVMTVYGTRPEAIKLAPVIRALEQSAHVRPLVVVTGQHRQMLDQVNDLFGIVPKHDLDMMAERQSLADITTRALTALDPLLLSERPDAVLVQGDTTTCFAAALSAFYRRVPVVHLEAGLRTHDLGDPFPEELNRTLTAQLTTLHLAPTARARANLEREGVPSERIVTTGNTVIDALQQVVARSEGPAVEDAAPGRRLVLVTMHRRESWGEPMRRVARAVASLARRFGDVTFLWPVHLNPVVREALLPELRDVDNVEVTEPLDYQQLAGVLARSELVLTDSGGLQEEAPSLGKPVLVVRETTERPEAVDAGTVRLIGTGEAVVVEEVTRLLTDPAAHRAMARAVNPYGDGHAAPRCVQAIEHLFGVADRPVDFTTG
jgi:UDP-N-acetylglucosamine 2-epimerase (non-hydrolysing)